MREADRMDVSGGLSGAPLPLPLRGRFPGGGWNDTHPRPRCPHARSPRRSTPAGACQAQVNLRDLLALSSGPPSCLPLAPRTPLSLLEAPGGSSM